VQQNIAAVVKPTQPAVVRVECAGEGGVCTVPAGKVAKVTYGVGNSWSVKANVMGPIGCSNGVFGDPRRGSFKRCFYEVTGTATECAGEHGVCTVPAGKIATVSYGAGVNWAAKASVTGAIGCNNNVFGDPLRGTYKRCYYQVTGSTVSTLATGLYSLQSVNYPNHLVRHQNARAKISTISSALDKADSTWKIVPALNGQEGAVSFESTNYPGVYLRHRNWEMWADRFDGSQLNKMDASFIQRAGNAGQGVSFESTNYPGRFIRHAGYLLWVHQKDGSDLFNKDSSFVPQRK